MEPLPPIPVAYDWSPAGRSEGASPALDTFRGMGQSAVDYVAAYHSRLAERALPVQPAVKPGFLADALPRSAPELPQGWESVMKTVTELVTPGMTHWQHPDFFAFFPAMVSPPALAADLIASSYGTPGFTWASGPSATELEVVVMNWMAQAFGLPAETYSWTGTGGGVLQPSATEAAVVAMAGARHKAAEKMESERKNNAGAASAFSLDKLVVYYSDQAHFCIEKAARILGVPHRRKIASVYDKGTDNHPMDIAALSAAIKADRAAGLIPLFISANYGATGTCAIDNLKAVAAVARSEEVWFNIDAAYAGITAVCPELRSSALDGLGEADSILINGSKWFSLLFNSTFFFFREKRHIVASLNATGVYLRDANTERGVVIDFKDYHLGLGRPFRALKVYAVLQSFGLEGLRNVIRRHIILAAYLVGRLRQSPDLEVRPAKFGLVVFRPAGGASDTVANRLLEAIHKKQLFMVPAMSNGQLWIRCSLAHPALDYRDMDRAADIIKDAAAATMRGARAPPSPRL